MIPVTMCRFYCPLQNLENIPGGSFRCGGGRLCSQTKEAGFQMIISSDTRLLIGINIEDLYDQPYIATWLHVFRDSYISELGVLDTKKAQLGPIFFCGCTGRSTQCARHSANNKTKLVLSSAKQLSANFFRRFTVLQSVFLVC